MPSIIKAGGPIRTIDGVTFNFDDMGIKADQYLDGVRGQAAGIIKEAEQAAVQIRLRAEEEGKQAAIRAVERVMEEKVNKQLTTLLPALQQVVRQLDEARHAWLRHWEQAAVHVSTQIAARVIRREVAQAPEITLELVREALDLAAGSSDIQIHLHPDDAAALGAQIELFARELAAVGTTQIVADELIAKGGCRIDTRFGVIDQQFAAQLQRIEEELT